MLGSGLDDERSGADESLEAGALFKGDGSGAQKLAPDIAVDAGCFRSDRVDELDTGSFFDAQMAADHVTDDFAAAADDEFAGAFHGAGKLTDEGQVVALDVRTGDRTGFLDHDIAASLDATVPMGGDVVVQQADVAAALGTLTGLGLADGGEGVAALEASDLAGWPDRIEQAH